MEGDFVYVASETYGVVRPRLVQEYYVDGNDPCQNEWEEVMQAVESVERGSADAESSSYPLNYVITYVRNGRDEIGYDRSSPERHLSSW